MKRFLPIILLIIIGLITYLPSFSGKLFWDDNDFIVKNEYVKNFQIGKFFTAQAVEGSGKVSNYFRPVQFTVYALTYKLFGPSPLAFHSLSIFIHVAATLAIYIFFALLFQQFSNLTMKQWNNEAMYKWFPFLIAIVFLIHPIQTEAVSYVSGLSDPLVTLFGFLTLVFFLNSRHQSIRIFNYPITQLPSYLIMIFLFLMTLLSKENGIIFAGIIFILAFYFDIYRDRNFPRFFMTVAPLFLLVFGYLLYHARFIDVTDMEVLYGNHPYAKSVSIRLSTFLSLLPTYIGVLLFPKDLFYERDFTITILTSPWNISSWTVLLITVILFVFLIIHHKRHSSFVIHYSLFIFLSFFLSFLPYTGLVIINGIMYEHFLYIPIIFFFAFAFVGVQQFSNLTMKQFNNKTASNAASAMSKTLWTGILLVIGGILIVRSWSRQYDWIDPIRLYQQTLTHAPNSFRVRNNLGMAYQEQGNDEAAIREYQRVIDLNPTIPNAYHNMGNLYFENNDYPQAEQLFQKAIAVDPYFGYSYAALLKLYQITDDKEKIQKISAEITNKFKQ